MNTLESEYREFFRGCKKSTLEKFCRFLRIDNKGTVVQLLDRLYRRFETDPADCFKIEAFRKFYAKRNPEALMPRLITDKENMLLTSSNESTATAFGSQLQSEAAAFPSLNLDQFKLSHPPRRVSFDSDRESVYEDTLDTIKPIPPIPSNPSCMPCTVNNQFSIMKDHHLPVRTSTVVTCTGAIPKVSRCYNNWDNVPKCLPPRTSIPYSYTPTVIPSRVKSNTVLTQAIPAPIPSMRMNRGIANPRASSTPIAPQAPLQITVNDLVQAFQSVLGNNSNNVSQNPNNHNNNPVGGRVKQKSDLLTFVRECKARNITFTGTEDIITFIEQFDNVRSYFPSLTEQELARSLRDLLSNDALLCLKTVPHEFTTWTRASRFLKNHYRPKYADQTYMADMMSRPQMEGESMNHFLSALIAFNKRLSVPVPEGLLVSYALNNALKSYRKACRGRNVQTIAELSEIGREVEVEREREKYLTVPPDRILKHPEFGFINESTSAIPTMKPRGKVHCISSEPSRVASRGEVPEDLFERRAPQNNDNNYRNNQDNYRGNNQDNYRSNRNFSSQPSRSTSPGQVICKNCDQIGHTRPDCTAPRRIRCDDCHEPGFVRTNCPKCNRNNNNNNKPQHKVRFSDTVSQQTQTINAIDLNDHYDPAYDADTDIDDNLNN